MRPCRLWQKHRLWPNGCRDSGIPAAWLSLDQRDNDLYTFLGYFVAALRTLFPEACPVAFRTVAASSPLFPEHMAELLAAELVNLPGPCILVLDDYHRIRASEVQACLGRLLEVLPETRCTWCLPAASIPSLPLARYQASGELCEVRGDDLRFTLAEATEFLTHNLSTDLSAEVIAALYGRTEGWIAALHLAAQSLRRQRDLAGPCRGIVAHADRQVAGYLLEEFLAQQTEPVQDFLLQTSILDRFCAPLCAAVTAGAHTQAADMYLEQLSRSNPLLLELDDRREWYRYHPLLQDFLRATLAKRLAPEEIGGLHRPRQRLVC